ncbi:hypothetical protein NR996_02040 [Lactobacillus rodentium]|uniref:Uncharacterized protein n=1 Tax=Lactobacillus rodentium TaxID=947835 RepID=A0A2Z6TEA6_9LACO|nr:hypothetical protein [Lactobacillus rodentium]MCR1894193.1 hypothetical protein [Lactobacillus rodentium]GBG04490.1 hypothetical protein LrDSM24759_04040 [Lactobacillus rodentium]
MKEEQKRELIKDIRSKQEQLEDEFYTKRREFNEKLALFNQTNRQLGQFYQETNAKVNLVLKKMDSAPEYYSKAEKLNSQLQEMTNDIYQREQRSLVNNWEEYEHSYRRQKINLEDKLSKLQMEK